MADQKKLSAPNAEKPAETPKKKKGDRDQLVLQIPVALKELLGTKAGEANQSMNVFATYAIATACGFDMSTVPVKESKARKKYATEEEKKAALKAAAETRRAEIKAALAEYRATHKKA